MKTTFIYTISKDLVTKIPKYSRLVEIDKKILKEIQN